MSNNGSSFNLPSARPINISFENISYVVPKPGIKNGIKQVIKGVNGEFRSGELTAIMGPSGAGKSSLLNILSGFSLKGMQGCIYGNGISTLQKEGSYKKDSCYIMQDDVLSPLLTVKEIMVSAAYLKLGIHMSHKAKMMWIDEILECLGLLESKETRCGELSGGQKKRVSIALELLDNPSVMFLDEPTTGLDSRTARQCVALLKSMAKNGRTIICTIHQPTALMYELFDHVYILSEGLAIYQGSAKNSIGFLNHVGLPCPQYHSIPDFFSEIAAGEHGDVCPRLSQATADTRWRAPVVPVRNDENTHRRLNLRPIPPSEFTKVWILINRNIILLYRDWTVTHLKIILHCAVGILLGFLFQGSGIDGNKTLQNVGFIFGSIIYLSYTTLMPAILKFPFELQILKKETFNNWYTIRAYYIAFVASNSPVQLMFVTVFTSISYYMTDQIMDLRRFAMFMAISMATTLTAEGLGLYLGTFKNILTALFFGSLFIAFLLVYSGVLALFPQMSAVLHFFSYFSFGRYSFSGMVSSVYGYGRESLACYDEYCHYRQPKMVLREMGVEDGHYWQDFGILCVMLIFFRVLAFVSLYSKIHKN